MELQNILFEKDAGVCIVTLNNPKTMNSLTQELLLELIEVMDEIAADPESRVVILTGGEKVFAAGGDIALMSTANTLGAEKYATLAGRAISRIEDLNLPVIAAISGMEFGCGCEMTLACDFRIAAEGAIFGTPEISLGIIPGAGATQRLTRVVGPGWAKHLIMTGKNIDTETALKIGLVTQVAPKEKLMDEAKKLAVGLAAKSPVAMKAAKSCVNYSMDVDLASGLAYELKNMAFLFSTQDQKEGMNAFLEKRKAQFIGK